MTTLGRIQNLVSNAPKCFRISARGVEQCDYPKSSPAVQLAAADNTIRLFGDIGEWGTTSGDFAAAMDSMPGNINLQIASDGGEIYNGLAMYGLLRNRRDSGAIVEAEIIANAFSIASVIPMAADNIVMHGQARMMIHEAWTIQIGNKQDFSEVQAELAEVDALLVDIYAARSGQSTEAIAEMMAAETYLRAEEAKELGLVDEIKDLATSESGDGEKKRKAALRRNREYATKALLAARIG